MRTGVPSFRGNVLRSLGFMQQTSDGQSVIHTFAPPQRRRRVRIDVNARGLMQMIGVLGVWVAVAVTVGNGESYN
jgi:hypothetical protein